MTNSYLCIIFILMIISQSATGCYTSIFSFGDSLSDNGNLLGFSSPRIIHQGRPPNGETYFRQPTGRCCDGRLIVDMIAQKFGLPIPPPYVSIRNAKSSRDFYAGVNFAVAGAKALDPSFFDEKGISEIVTNFTLGVQLDWFKDLLPSLCGTKANCMQYLQSSVTVMGEIGGNDYNHALLQGRSIEEVKTFVPAVVGAISSAITDMIRLGAVNFIVPGNLPFGCTAAYLTYFQKPNRDYDYDKATGCINWLNEFAKHHNELLQIELNRIKELHPHATIIYADYYNSAMRFYLSPKKFVRGCYTSIFALGDSLTDNGNLLALSAPRVIHQGRLPNGETYFHHPTGRCCDGRLIVDFLAQQYGLPIPPPYTEVLKARSMDVRAGVNFAVAGARALDTEFYDKIGIIDPVTNDTLRVQLDWFKHLLPSICSSENDCAEQLKSSLVLVGPFGGNDYRYALFQGTSLKERKLLAHLITDAAVSAANELAELGVGTVMVPGLVPDGCLAVSLTYFGSPNMTNYDPSTGCINWLNEFAEFHNELLQTKLNMARERHPSTTIVYADYYHAILQLYRNPEEYGFRRTNAACCGDGGPYNYNKDVQCGDPPTIVCPDPSEYINWDGPHFTDAANRWITAALLEGPYTIPHLDTSCISESANSRHFAYA